MWDVNLYLELMNRSKNECNNNHFDHIIYLSTFSSAAPSNWFPGKSLYYNYKATYFLWFLFLPQIMNPIVANK